MKDSIVNRSILIRNRTCLELEVSNKYSEISKIRLSNLNSEEKLKKIRSIYNDIDSLKLKIDNIDRNL